MRMPSFCINKTGARIGCAVVAQLVGAFIFFSLQTHDYSFAFKI